MVQGKRYQVFSIKEVIENENKKSIWVKAGSAWANRDGSMNVYLDVLPLDGKLHVREPMPEQRQSSAQGDGKSNNNSNTERPLAANGSPTWASDSMGGH
ncbi:MAG: hypothetical protein U0228_37435 [Myxococcaceae bacterium]